MWIVANGLPALHSPMQDVLVLRLQLWVSVAQAQKVGVRPSVTGLVLGHMVSQFVSMLRQIPVANAVAETTAPATHRLHIVSEVEQVRRNARRRRELTQCELRHILALVGHGQSQSQQGGIVLWSAACIADLGHCLAQTECHPPPKQP